METTIVKIGNSKGLIIPKKLLTAFGDATQVDIKAKDGALIITPLEGINQEVTGNSNFTQPLPKDLYRRMR
jgi:antitoxin component of MazEF toxin-antitoxin module